MLPSTLANWLLSSYSFSPLAVQLDPFISFIYKRSVTSHSCKLASRRYSFSLVVQLDPFISLFFIFTFHPIIWLIFRFNYMCFQVFLLLPSSLSFLGLFYSFSPLSTSFSSSSHAWWVLMGPPGTKDMTLLSAGHPVKTCRIAVFIRLANLTMFMNTRITVLVRKEIHNIWKKYNITGINETEPKDLLSPFPLITLRTIHLSSNFEVL